MHQFTYPGSSIARTRYAIYVPLSTSKYKIFMLEEKRLYMKYTYIFMNKQVPSHFEVSVNQKLT